MLVAQADERIVGFRSFLRWRFDVGGRKLRAVRAVDTATHPSYQGRGIFSKLTLEALDRLRTDTDLVFNTPNSKSMPGYLKMGWEHVGKLPVTVRIRKPLRFGLNFRARSAAAPRSPSPVANAAPASEVLARLTELPAVAPPATHGLATERDLSYLRWRYSAPGLDYRAVMEERDGETAGVAVFRMRARGGLWEATVAELLAPTGGGVAKDLLVRTRRAAGTDHLTLYPGEHRAAARRTGFVPVPGGTDLVVNTLGHRIEPDPTQLDSWQLSLGDIEVF
jgi:hypothetical protein